MQDSVTKIQQPADSKQEIGWAFFSKPYVDRWSFVNGSVNKFNECNDANRGSMKMGVIEFEESGFYFQGFSSNSIIQQIQGTAAIIDTIELPDLLNACIKNSRIPEKLNIQDSTTQELFFEEIKRIKQQIEAGNFSKIVAARKQTWVTDVWDFNVVSDALVHLKKCYPQTFVFIVYTPEIGIWMGASPEQLLTVNESQANVMALAGTLTRDQREWTAKEEEEQQVTHDFIGDVLAKFGLLATETIRRELQLQNVRHLLREWRFPFDFSDTYRLVKALHPTPAVSGYPQRNSVQWLEANESFNRKLYAGWLGYLDKDRETVDFYVALRCGELFQNAVTGYAGCGINTGSDVEVEWTETEYKLSMLVDVVFAHIKQKP
jgi:isochorismate synthase